MKNFLFAVFLSFSLAEIAGQDHGKIGVVLRDTVLAGSVQGNDAALNLIQDGYTTASLPDQKAEALIRLGKFEEAEALLRQADEGKDTIDAGAPVTLTTHGLLCIFLGKYEVAFNRLQDAVRRFEQLKQGNTLEAARALSYLGNLYYTTGQYAQAEEHQSIALAIRRTHLGVRHALIAASYNDLGLVYSATDPDNALTYYNKARDIYGEVYGVTHPKIAITDTNIGQIYQQLELYSDAVKHYESALRIWSTVYAKAHPAKAFVLFSLGLVHAQRSNAPAAREYYDKALKMYHEAYGAKHPDVARTFNAIGILDLHERQYDRAITQFEKAMLANTPDLNEPVDVRPPDTRYYDGNVLLHSLMNKAEALEARHFGKTLKFKDLDNAIETLKHCDTLIERLRQQITRESDKILLGGIASEVYAAGVRISVEAREIAFRKKDYGELAFYFSERSKAAVLLQAISESHAKSFAGIPSKLLDAERDLKEELARCTRELAQKPSPEKERQLRETSFRVNRSYEAFIRKLEAEFPEYYDLKFNTKTPAVSEVQTRLGSSTALLSYFLDEKNQRLYIFCITKKRYRIMQAPVPGTFNKLVTGLRNSIYFNDLSIFRNTASKLSPLLIPRNVPSSIKQLIIIPTAKLSTVPFETLFTKTPEKDGNFHALPYLLKRYSVSYYFSSSLLAQDKLSLPQTPSILLCAPVEFPDEDNLQKLPGTASEVAQIASLFAGKNLRQEAFTHKLASEELVKSNMMKDYDLLHFATHGIVDEDHPELSRIFLQPASSEDGDLFASEIYNLALRAKLVTLSACQTGLGRISGGEGVIGLSRALVYAGAENCIVSFWNVADESTAVLMTNFYTHMLTDPLNTFSKSLRNAKLDLMKDAKFSSPYYWAPFILIGN